MPPGSSLRRLGAAVLIGGALLALLLVRQYGYRLAPDDLQADAWNIGAAVAVAVLSFGWALYARSRMVWAVWLAVLWHEASVVICSAAYMVRPWPVPPGVAQCSAWVGADLMRVGVFVAVLACVPMAAALSRSRRDL